MNATDRPANDRTNVRRISLRFPVMGLHCSGADGSQWSWLQNALSHSTEVLAPNLIGTSNRGPWRGTSDFRLSYEAEAIVEQLESLRMPVHVVGHSFGAALSLHIARKRPDLVRSLCLYEPTLFCLLNNDSELDQSLYQEIKALTLDIGSKMKEGRAESAAQVFTDFWSGPGTWQALNADRRAALVNWAPKAPLDFEALLNEPTSDRFFVSDKPVKLMVGDSTHRHTARIAALLAAQNNSIDVVTLDGAGHLGPFTHRDPFENEVLSHIQMADV